MNKRSALRRRQTPLGQTGHVSRDRQPIRWRAVGGFVVLVVASAAAVVYALGWWPTVVEGTKPAEPPASQPLQPARLEALPTVAVFPPVEELRQEADEISRDLRERFPQSANAFHIAARQASELRQYEDAERWWRKAIELAPQLPAPRTGLASVELQQGRREEAIKILETVMAEGYGSADVYGLFAQGLQETGDFEKALQACNTGLQLDPDSTELLLQRGQIQMQQQQLQSARKDFERILELNPQALSARSSLASVLARLGEDQLAAQQRQRYEQLKTTDPLAGREFDDIYRAALQQIVINTLVDAARQYRQHGDLDTAERLLVRALTLQPANAPACKALVTLFREQARIADAYTVQARLVKIQPTLEHQINLAGFAMPLQKFAEAEAALGAAIELDPDSLVAHRTLALLYLNAGYLPTAKSHAEQVCRIGGAAEDYQLLGQICLELDDEAGYHAALRKAEAASGR